MGHEKRKGKIVNPSTVDSDDEYETHRDLDAVIRHHAIKKDPSRMKKVHSLAARKLNENKGKKAEAEHAIKLGKKGE